MSFCYCMANRMTKIKQCTFSLLFSDHVLQHLALISQQRQIIFFRSAVSNCCIFCLLRTHKSDKTSPSQISPVFKTSPNATGKLFCRKRTQLCEGSYNKTRLMESTYHVFDTAPDLLRSYLQHCCPPEKEVL